MSEGKITFKGHSGAQLAARLDTPSGDLRATAIFAHCFTCSKDIMAARRIAQRLASMGIAVLRFDFTGLGHSEGEFANTDFSSNVEDIVAAANYLKAEGQAPSLLIGHSLGGAAVLKAAADIETIKAVVTIGAPYCPSHVLHNFGSSLEDIKEKGEAEVSLAGRPFLINQNFVENVSQENLEPAIANLKKALLVLHSPTDVTVGIENAADIFQAAKHPKSFVTLDGADHLLSDSEDAEYAADVICAWAIRYLGIITPARPIGVPEGIVRSTEAEPEGFLQDVTAGPLHHILADEPVTYGGTDKGMTPYQMMSAALAACTSMTVRMYARRKGWPLEHVFVDVTHNKVHAQDCDTCMFTDGMIDLFNRSIHLFGDLTDEQRTKLMEISGKCPVHKTLSGQVSISTNLVEGRGEET